MNFPGGALFSQQRVGDMGGDRKRTHGEEHRHEAKDDEAEEAAEQPRPEEAARVGVAQVHAPPGTSATRLKARPRGECVCAVWRDAMRVYNLGPGALELFPLLRRHERVHREPRRDPGSEHQRLEHDDARVGGAHEPNPDAAGRRDGRTRASRVRGRWSRVTRETNKWRAGGRFGAAGWRQRVPSSEGGLA